MSITIITNDARWKGLGPTITRAGEAALAQRKLKSAALSILLTNDKEVRALNAQYRGKDKPTNVLSFPDGEVIGGVRQLGDVAMAYETIAREAKAQKKPLKAHVTHLTIHGVLHLLGYDHESESDAETMESIEINILKRMGIANPYEAS